MDKKILSKNFIANKNGELTLEQTQIGEPQEREVLVKVAAFGINRADLLQLKGMYPPPVGESEILGLEYSGEVIKVGSQVKLIKAGQRVAGLCGSGAYSEFIVADENLVMPLPDTVDLIEAAGFPEVFGTAFYNLYQLNSVDAGQKLLIHSAAGGVGLAAIQLLIAKGLDVHAIVGSEEKLRKLRELNVAGVYNYKEGGYEILESEHDNSFDFILDTVGGSLLDFHINLLGQNGVIQNIGLLGGSKGNLDFAKVLKKNLTISSSTLRNQPLEVKAKLIENLKKHVLTKVGDGSLSLNIYKTLSVGEINHAFEILGNNQNFGKVIVKW